MGLGGGVEVSRHRRSSAEITFGELCHERDEEVKLFILLLQWDE